jgi:hypothetical protein
MTGWISERAAQRYELWGHTAKIEAETPRLWKALFDAISEVCTEYGGRFPGQADPHDYLNNGAFAHTSFFVEVLKEPVTPGFDKHLKRKLSVTLDQATHKIKCDCTGCAPSEIQIGIGKERDVALIDAAGEMTLAQAVEKIMDPFLFPDLKAEKRQSATCLNTARSDQAAAPVNG